LLFLVFETIFFQGFTPAVNGGILSLIKDGPPYGDLKYVTPGKRKK